MLSGHFREIFPQLLILSPSLRNKERLTDWIILKRKITCFATIFIVLVTIPFGYFKILLLFTFLLSSDVTASSDPSIKLVSKNIITTDHYDWQNYEIETHFVEKEADNLFPLKSLAGQGDTDLVEQLCLPPEEICLLL